MRRSHGIVPSLAIVVLVAGSWWLRKQIAIDSCLDSGGAWDYIANECAPE